MTYRITYTTDTHPTDLPDGATVEKVSALPVEIEGAAHHNSFTLDASGNDQFLAYFQIEGRGRQLTRAQTVQVRDALNELLGETAPEWDGHSEPPADVEVVQDRDGDHWHRLADGTWSTNRYSREGVAWLNEFGICPADYTPHTIILRK